LARCIADSAWRTSVVGIAAVAGNSATPMLQVSVNCAPSTEQGCATALSTRRAVASAPAAVGLVHQQGELVAAHARHQVALAQAPFRRSAHVQQHAVAHSWPRLSLICLKRSRSSSSSASVPAPPAPGGWRRPWPGPSGGG
jgi:hypothetical protein